MNKSRMSDAVQAASKVASEGAEALKRLLKVIHSPEFEKAVEICFQCEGLIYIIGIGKSGLVGQKIAATFTSVGSPANYIHAGDALHGDLGAIRSSDVTILISKSGQTKDVLNIIPFLKSQKNKIIAFTNELTSDLAKQADVALPTLVTSEGCPLNLAPMTSSTVTMTLGDAIAAALIVAKDFTPASFARIHPGGMLGFMLTATVSDMLGPDSNRVVKGSSALRDAVVELVECRLGGVNIVDGDGKLAGVLTDGDLKRIMVKDKSSLLNDPVINVMAKNPTVIKLTASAAEAIEIMENRDRQLSILPVVDNDGKPVGILRLHDIIRSHL
ncbi:D-arabinose 5-phosphate isomerase [hydrothermal vent metagenome]|uniref:D-arabinose 5-phosphate isomerase n=1 Tax=hydrothermal vent metagenome TaxID=652676 RepID=A0A3B1BF79_9ZZZZ